MVGESKFRGKPFVTIAAIIGLDHMLVIDVNIEVRHIIKSLTTEFTVKQMFLVVNIWVTKVKNVCSGGKPIMLFTCVDR